MRILILLCAFLLAPAALAADAVATFAGGCFWCMESDFQHQPGVKSVISGYTGGTEANPTYEQVSSHQTGHAESVEIHFDPAVVSYEALLDHYWTSVDPLTRDAQFCDEGHQYRTAIFYHDEAQKDAALASKAKYEKLLGQPFVTEIVAAGKFYPAEDYHQDYFEKNPIRYRYYRASCGRDRRLDELWGAAHQH
jgi:peptide-methionine (S)-S-oxide reductase